MPSVERAIEYFDQPSQRQSHVTGALYRQVIRAEANPHRKYRLVVGVGTEDEAGFLGEITYPTRPDASCPEEVRVYYNFASIRTLSRSGLQALVSHVVRADKVRELLAYIERFHGMLVNDWGSVRDDPEALALIESVWLAQTISLASARTPNRVLTHGRMQSLAGLRDSYRRNKGGSGRRNPYAFAAQLLAVPHWLDDQISFDRGSQISLDERRRLGVELADYDADLVRDIHMLLIQAPSSLVAKQLPIKHARLIANPWRYAVEVQRDMLIGADLDKPSGRWWLRLPFMAEEVLWAFANGLSSLHNHPERLNTQISNGLLQSVSFPIFHICYDRLFAAIRDELIDLRIAGANQDRLLTNRKIDAIKKLLRDRWQFALLGGAWDVAETHFGGRTCFTYMASPILR